jgi:hypothetical protein
MVDFSKHLKNNKTEVKTMPEELGRELSWDSSISKDSEFVLLEEQDCDFEVLDFERQRHGGGGKIPACPKAVLSIKLHGKEGTTTVNENLLLHSLVEWKLCEFFKAIGQRKHGEELQMNWNKVAGAKGRCHIYIDEWTNDKGEKKKNNKIKYFIDPAESNKFTAGKF